jgi:hypothetical protein
VAAGGTVNSRAVRARQVTYPQTDRIEKRQENRAFGGCLPGARKRQYRPVKNFAWVLDKVHFSFYKTRAFGARNTFRQRLLPG